MGWFVFKFLLRHETHLIKVNLDFSLENGLWFLSPFVACDFCSYPVCRPCYEYERKHGNHSCPQCKTTYKRLKGTFPFFLFPYISSVNLAFEHFMTSVIWINWSLLLKNIYWLLSQVVLPFPEKKMRMAKDKISERMLGWRLTRGKGEEIEHSRYDKQVSHNLIPRLTSRQEVKHYGFSFLCGIHIASLHQAYPAWVSLWILGFWFSLLLIDRFLVSFLLLHLDARLYLLSQLVENSFPIRQMSISHVLTLSNICIHYSEASKFSQLKTLLYCPCSKQKGCGRKELTAGEWSRRTNPVLWALRLLLKGILMPPLMSLLMRLCCEY